jgi:hypothetical protein
MAKDQNREDSDVDNMQVAYDRGLELMQEHLKGDSVSPALYAVISSLWEKAVEASPTIAIMAALDPTVKTSLIISFTQAFFTGQEWGKSGRELYIAPAVDYCNDPAHNHHRSRLN